MTETLPLAEQIAFFSLADVIIAQHGAALSNLITAPGNAARNRSTDCPSFAPTSRIVGWLTPVSSRPLSQKGSRPQLLP